MILLWSIAYIEITVLIKLYEYVLITDSITKTTGFDVTQQAYNTILTTSNKAVLLHNNNNIKRLLTAEIGVLLAFNLEDRAYV